VFTAQLRWVADMVESFGRERLQVVVSKPWP